MFGNLVGKPLAEALRVYGDAASMAVLDERRLQYDALKEAIGSSHPDAIAFKNRLFDFEWKIQKAFVRRLSSGLLLATGLAMPLKATSWREIISQDLWSIFEIDFEHSRASAHNLTFVEVQVLKPIIVSNKPKPVPPPEFEATSDFSKVRMREFQYEFGPIQSNVVRLLARVARAENPWLEGKSVMSDAGSTSLKIGDLFKNTPNWKELVEGNGAGDYRLKLLTHSMKERTEL